MMVTHPFFDRRAFSLGLGIRSRVRPEPGGQKPILAAAMRGILPECTLNRSLKGHLNEPYYIGLSRNLPYLEALVEQAPVDDLGFLDRQASSTVCSARAGKLRRCRGHVAVRGDALAPALVDAAMGAAAAPIGSGAASYADAASMAA
jgi:hypothetical protein